jgi:hypothetical protein
VLTARFFIILNRELSLRKIATFVNTTVSRLDRQEYTKSTLPANGLSLSTDPRIWVTEETTVNS